MSDVIVANHSAAGRDCQKTKDGPYCSQPIAAQCSVGVAAGDDGIALSLVVSGEGWGEGYWGETERRVGQTDRQVRSSLPSLHVGWDRPPCRQTLKPLIRVVDENPVLILIV